MKNKPITVLIVDDSLVVRELLAYIIQKDPELKVIGFAANGEEALNWLKFQTPDVITMDIQMPGMNGFEVTREILKKKPIPIIIITSAYTTANTEMAFQAIEAGALAILEKPLGLSAVTYQSKAQEMIQAIKEIAEIKPNQNIKISKLINTKELFPSIKKERQVDKIQAIAIGASLGGPVAIAEILSKLPLSFSVPIFIVQHIAPGFIEGFIKWMQKSCSLPIVLAQHGEKAIPQHVYIAPDHHEMEIKKGNIISLESSKTKSQPTVGHLFLSMAHTYGHHGIGVILTGMGKDGANELLLMKQHGAYTIAQDEQSSIMFGMPREAIEIGAICQVLPLNKIAPALIYLTSSSHDS